MIKIPIVKLLHTLKTIIPFMLAIFFAVLIFCDNDKSVIRDMTKVTDDGWEYIRLYDSDKNLEYIVVTGFERENKYGELAIPGYIEDLPVKVIKGHIFNYGQEIGKLTIPSTVEQMLDNCFDMADIDEIVFSDYSYLKRIDGRGALSSKNVEELHLPESLEYIGVGAFSYCFNLKTLYIGPNVREIGDGAFWATDDLQKIIVDPENEWFEVRDGFLIDKSESKVLAYEHKEGINEITIPAYVKEIDDETLDGELSKINVEDGNEFYTSINGCLYTKDGKKLCRVPKRMEIDDFSFAEGTEEIGSFSFRGCFFDEKVVIPDSVKYIDFWAFDNQKLYISKSLRAADLQGFIGSIHFMGTEQDWNRIEVINAIPEDILEYDLYFEED